MKINSKRFPNAEIEASKIIDFPDGIPGFESQKKFTIIADLEYKPFLFLQSCDSEDISFTVMNPFELFPDYAPEIPEKICQQLKMREDLDDIAVLNLVVVSQGANEVTMNLMSPVIINGAERLGKQIVLDRGDYKLRQPILDLLRKKRKEEEGASC